MLRNERSPTRRELVRDDPIAPVWRVVDPDGRARLVRVLAAASPTLRDRFERVAAALRGLSHPNLVEVIEALEVEGRPAVLTAHADGPTLGAWVRAEPRSAHQLVRVFVGVARGVSALHRAGVVHGHLEPHRIVLDPELAHLRPRIDDAVLGRPVTPQGVHADLVALGCLLRELLSALPPERRAEVPEALDHLAAALTAPTPDPVLASAELVIDRMQRDPAIAALLPPSSRPTRLHGSGPTLLPTDDVDGSLAPSVVPSSEVHPAEPAPPARRAGPDRTVALLAVLATLGFGLGAALSLALAAVLSLLFR